MKKILTNPIFITALIIILGVGGLVYATTRLVPAGDADSAQYVEQAKWKTDSEIVLTEYGDFQCGGCKTFNDTTSQQLKEAYGDKVKFVFKHLPLTSIHPSAQRAAEAAEAAGAQGKFWEYHDLLYARQSEAAGWNTNKLTDYAKELGLDSEKFREELRGNVYRKIVRDSYDEAFSKGYSVTPTILINGQKIENPTFENIDSKLKEILGQKGLANN